MRRVVLAALAGAFALTPLATPPASAACDLGGPPVVCRVETVLDQFLCLRDITC